MKSRVVVCRTDRLGDVLLSLPALATVQASLVGSHQVDFLVTESLVELLAPFLKSLGVEPIAYSVTSKSWWNSVVGKGCAGSVCYFHDEVVARALKQGTIPLRVGNYSKISSFFLYTKGRFQRRSRSLKSESEYALELSKLLVEGLGKNVVTVGDLELPACAEVWQTVKKKYALDTPYWVLHPGMGGSAENLSVEAYSHLARLVQARLPHTKMWISRGPAPADAKFSELDSVFKESGVIGGMSLVEFSEFLRHAALVVAPSTGPLHLAHWVGAPTLGLFSCVRSQWASRWAPQGGTGNSRVWSPVGACGGKKNCVRRQGGSASCMEDGVLKWNADSLSQILS